MYIFPHLFVSFLIWVQFVFFVAVCITLVIFSVFSFPPHSLPLRDYICNIPSYLISKIISVMIFSLMFIAPDPGISAHFHFSDSFVNPEVLDAKDTEIEQVLSQS